MSAYCLLWLCVMMVQLPHLHAGHYTLSMDSETSCTKTHYYEAGDVFKVLVKGSVHDGHCPLTFIQSGSYRSESIDDPCVSVCVKIISYTMQSCEVRMSYHDGLNDFTPVTFDCHTFPPVMWCSSKNELKVAVSEQKNYKDRDYSVNLEVTPFCGTYQHTTDSGVVVQTKTKSTSMSQVVLIVGSVVGTISIMFVLGWVMYCYKKRRTGDEDRAAPADRRPDRQTRDTTPSQGTRYAPVDRKQNSSQSSSDRGVGTPFTADMDRTKPGAGINNFGERRLYSPFQPPTQTNRGPGVGTQPFYSDLDRGPGPGPGEKWFPMTTVGQSQSNLYANVGQTQPNIYSNVGQGQGQGQGKPDQLYSTAGQPQPGLYSKVGGQPGAGLYSTAPSNQTSQYLAQNQVYNYPQYNNADGEMHTAPTDTRYVVYDFDFDQPVERKYSTGKNRRTPVNDSPVKELDKLRKREITPLRETVRVMPPIDSTTTDHTSEYESSVSGTTEDETTTDDQMPPPIRPFNMVVPYGHFGQSSGARPNDPNSRLYDPRNFQRVDTGSRPIVSDSARPSVQRPSVQSEAASRPVDNRARGDSAEGAGLGFRRPSGPDDSPGDRAKPREGPMPQVPPIPKDFQRSQAVPQAPTGSTSRELPWPHGPPPPYSPAPPYNPDDSYVV